MSRKPLGRYEDSSVRHGILDGEIHRLKKVVALMEKLQRGDPSAKDELLRMSSNVSYAGPTISLRLDDLFDSE